MKTYKVELDDNFIIFLPLDICYYGLYWTYM